jgi:hypothetical protein
LLSVAAAVKVWVNVPLVMSTRELLSDTPRIVFDVLAERLTSAEMARSVLPSKLFPFTVLMFEPDTSSACNPVTTPVMPLTLVTGPLEIPAALAAAAIALAFASPAFVAAMPACVVAMPA